MKFSGLEFVGAAALALVSLSAMADPVSYGPTTDAFVSPRLPLNEQNYLLQTLRHLPSNIQNSAGSVIVIVDGRDGSVHVNRPEAAGVVHVELSRADENGAAPAGNPACPAPHGFNPGCFAGSGPYRRIYTSPVMPAPVFSFASNVRGAFTYQNAGTVTIACKAGAFSSSPKRRAVVAGPEQYLQFDAGYSYLGGWSPTPEGTGDAGNAAAVDAGLLYNYELTAISTDSYSLFLAISGVGFISIDTFGPKGSLITFGPTPPHVPCSPSSPSATVNLAFQVVAYTFQGNTTSGVVLPPDQQCGKTDDSSPPHGNGNLACVTYALIVSDGTHQIIWISPRWNFGSWAKLVRYYPNNVKTNPLYYLSQIACENCVFKWMTSVGQTHSQNLSDGSKYTATWSNRQISGWATSDNTPDLVALPSDLMNCTEYPIWIPPYATPYDGDCKNSPAKLKGTAALVTVTGFTSDGETDSLSLTH